MRRMSDELSSMLKNDRYQVFLLSCPAALPVSFASHPWFVVNRKGALSRWDVLLLQRTNWKMRWGHLHKDFFSPFEGVEMFFFTDKYKWSNVTLLGVVEGGEGSLAHRMADLIESSPQSYPCSEKYRLTGPNSNTYAQWILDRFPECGLRLPWNSVGKHCTIKST